MNAKRPQLANGILKDDPEILFSLASNKRIFQKQQENGDVPETEEHTCRAWKTAALSKHSLLQPGLTIMSLKASHQAGREGPDGCGGMDAERLAAFAVGDTFCHF